MKTLSLLLAALTASSLVAPVATGAVLPSVSVESDSRAGADDKISKLLVKWLKSYNKGKIIIGGGWDDLRNRRLKKKDIGVKGGLIQPGKLSDIPREATDHEDELRAICKAVAEANDLSAAKALLQCAAVGLDRKVKYAAEMVPAIVREIGEEHVDQITNGDALKWIGETALTSGKKPSEVAFQAAAIRMLGRAKNVRYIETLVTGMASEHALVRLHAADAIYIGQYKAAIPSLVERLGVETDDTVKMRLVDAMHRVCEAHKDAIDAAEYGDVATAVGNQVGESKWQYDLSAVSFLEFLRRKQCVPPLIKIITRFAEADASAPLDSSHSNIVRLRAYEVLREISGAAFPMEDAAAWNKWWGEVEAEFEPTEDKVSYEGVTSTAEFFGVPVEGSRVLFVVDTSGSMDYPKAGKLTGKLSGVEKKMDVAKRELLATAEKLPEGSAFNLAQFGASAEVWQKKLVSADEANIKKFGKFVEKLRAGGGTNLWDGLKAGLDAHSFVHGDRFGVDVDEVFILSTAFQRSVA